MGIIVGIVLFWIMWVTIEGELIDEGTIKPKKPRNDLQHLFEDDDEGKK